MIFIIINNLFLKKKEKYRFRRKPTNTTPSPLRVEKIRQEEQIGEDGNNSLG